jgi:hypothetical protein
MRPGSTRTSRPGPRALELGPEASWTRPGSFRTRSGSSRPRPGSCRTVNPWRPPGDVCEAGHRKTDIVGPVVTMGPFRSLPEATATLTSTPGFLIHEFWAGPKTCIKNFIHLQGHTCSRHQQPRPLQAVHGTCLCGDAGSQGASVILPERHVTRRGVTLRAVICAALSHYVHILLA